MQQSPHGKNKNDYYCSHNIGKTHADDMKQPDYHNYFVSRKGNAVARFLLMEGGVGEREGWHKIIISRWVTENTTWVKGKQNSNRQTNRTLCVIFFPLASCLASSLTVCVCVNGK